MLSLAYWAQLQEGHLLSNLFENTSRLPAQPIGDPASVWSLCLAVTSLRAERTSRSWEQSMFSFRLALFPVDDKRCSPQEDASCIFASSFLLQLDTVKVDC